MSKRSQSPFDGTDGQSGATACRDGGLTGAVTSEAEASSDLSACDSASAEARPRRGRVIATANA